MGKRIEGGHVRSIWRRDKRICWICNHVVAKLDASRDHLKVRSKGGYDKSKNYRLAHKDCNNARGDLMLELVEQVIRSLPPKASAQVVQQALREKRHGYNNILRKSKVPA